MVWNLFKKKNEITQTWTFKKDPNVSLIDSFVNQMNHHLIESYSNGKFEYDDGFVEFIVERGSATYRFRFEIKKYTREAIKIMSFGLWIAMDELEVQVDNKPHYEDRYYRISFRLDDIVEYKALNNYKFHDFETRSESDFAILFNEIGFIWHNGCVRLIEQIDSVQSVLSFCEEMQSKGWCYGLSDRGVLAYLHCQCLMIMKLDWQKVFLSYERVLTLEQFEKLRKDLQVLALRYDRVN